MKISFAVTVWNEHVELRRLLDGLEKHVAQAHEVVIQYDDERVTPEVLQVFKDYQNGWFRTVGFPLRGDFAAYKNNLFSVCTGDWIFQLDADEEPHVNLLVGLPDLLNAYRDIDVFYVPRINVVAGITPEHLRRWGWREDPVPLALGQVKAINFPDYQCRIYRNVEHIRWVNKVHERLTGQKSHTALPAEYQWCLYHRKDIERQERQNNFYDTL
jgi:glycosyltransferase involved in cell wall biosynthesis